MPSLVANRVVADDLKNCCQAADIPLINPKTAHITHANYYGGLLSFPNEVLAKIYSYIAPEVPDLPAAAKVLDVSVCHSAAHNRQALLVCRDFYHGLCEKVYGNTLYIIRKLPTCTIQLSAVEIVNVLEQYTRILSPKVQNTITKLVFAWEDQLGEETKDSLLSTQLARFLPCIKWLPKLESVMVVNVGRQVWCNEWASDLFDCDMTSFAQDIDDILALMQPHMTFTPENAAFAHYYPVNLYNKFIVNWEGKSAQDPERLLAIVAGMYVNQFCGASGWSYKLIKGMQETPSICTTCMEPTNEHVLDMFAQFRRNLQTSWYDVRGDSPAYEYELEFSSDRFGIGQELLTVHSWL